MDCERIRELLEHRLEGRLDREAEEVFDVHLAECGECRALYEAHAGLDDMLASMEAPGLPADFTKGVMDFVDRRTARPISTWKITALAASVLVLLLAAFAGSSMLESYGIDIFESVEGMSISVSSLSTETAATAADELGLAVEEEFSGAWEYITAALDEAGTWKIILVSSLFILLAMVGNFMYLKQGRKGVNSSAREVRNAL